MIQAHTGRSASAAQAHVAQSPAPTLVQATDNECCSADACLSVQGRQQAEVNNI